MAPTATKKRTRSTKKKAQAPRKAAAKPEVVFADEELRISATGKAGTPNRAYTLEARGEDAAGELKWDRVNIPRPDDEQQTALAAVLRTSNTVIARLCIMIDKLAS